MTTRKTYKHCYFKDSGSGLPFISGRPLPVDTDGIVRNIDFIACDFHPICKCAMYEGCTFTDCRRIPTEN